MGYRQDAVYGFAKMCAAVIDRGLELGDPLVVTFGKVEPKPNTVNVVPGEVLFTMDCRHTDGRDDRCHGGTSGEANRQTLQSHA